MSRVFWWLAGGVCAASAVLLGLVATAILCGDDTVLPGLGDWDCGLAR